MMDTILEIEELIGAYGFVLFILAAILWTLMTIEVYRLLSRKGPFDTGRQSSFDNRARWDGKKYVFPKGGFDKPKRNPGEFE